MPVGFFHFYKSCGFIYFGRAWMIKTFLTLKSNCHISILGQTFWLLGILICGFNPSNFRAVFDIFFCVSNSTPDILVFIFFLFILSSYFSYWIFYSVIQSWTFSDLVFIKLDSILIISYNLSVLILYLPLPNHFLPELIYFRLSYFQACIIS